MFVKFKWLLVSIFDYFKFLIFIFSIPKNSKFLIVISHNEDSNGGASVVLNELLDHMDLDNYVVIVLCKTGGDLIKQNNYNYFVYQYIFKFYIAILKLFSVKAILVNTIICSGAVKIVQKYYKCPIVWWLHEDIDLFEKQKNKLPNKINDNVKVLCVSDTTQKIFRKFYPNHKSSILHYGIKDSYSGRKETKSNQFQIGIIGMLCERKNQLQIIQLLKRLPFDVANKVKFTVIAGTWDKDYKEKFLLESKNFNQVEFIAGISHDKLMGMYNEFDLLLCCSKYDPLPVVVTEALMMKCLCLVSSGCGQYKYIENGKNGYKYEVNDLDVLLNKIIYIINNVNNKNYILNNARKLYINEFSMDQTIKKISTYLCLK